MTDNSSGLEEEEEEEGGGGASNLFGPFRCAETALKV